MPVLALRHRRTLHEKLSPIVGDEEAEALLAQFPATPGEEPVTVSTLHARFAVLRSELTSELTTGIHRTVGAGLLGGLTIGMGVAAAVGAG